MNSMRRKTISGAIATTGALLVHGSRRGAAAAAAATTVAASAGRGHSGLDLQYVDHSVKPGDDFFRYVNGGWVRTHEIPPDQSRWDAFTVLEEQNRHRTRELLESAQHAAADAEAVKLGDLYAGLMDETRAESLGLTPVAEHLALITRMDSRADLARALARLSRDIPITFAASSLASPVAARIVVDQKQPTRYLAAFTQGGLGVPDRDYLLTDIPAYEKVRSAYQAHLARLFQLAQMSDPDKRAERVLDLETRLARSQWTRVDQRDDEKTYNIWSRRELAGRAPGMDWDALLEVAGLGDRGSFQVREPSAITAAAGLVGSAPIETWRDYLLSRTLRTFAPLGPRAFVDESFAYEGRVLSGTPELPARWKRCIPQVETAMGPALGRLYLQKYFPPSAQAEAQSMVVHIKQAMEGRIRALSWMSAATKTQALRKLAAVRIELGAETGHRDFSQLTIARDAAYANVSRAAQFEYDRKLRRIDQPVDRGEWTMLAETVNAQSARVLTKIMFPAGILQPPFFEDGADRAVNYGAIGVVIGHELSHQFDDQGAKTDENGALRNWWQPQDYEHFKAATAALAAQYDRYEPLPGMHINGRLTLGENIGDLAGLALARDAYRMSLGSAPAPVVDGLTGEQRFFMAYAQIWRSRMREPMLRKQLASNPHSPPQWRVAELRNVDAWYEAFDVTPQASMYLPPAERVRVW